MRRTGNFCDLTIISRGTHVQCHTCMIGPCLKLAGSLPVGSSLGGKCEIEMHDYNAKALLIAIEHIYGMDVTKLLKEAPPTSLADVCRLGTTWGLPALVDLTAHMLGTLAEGHATADLKSILGSSVAYSQNPVRQSVCRIDARR